MTTNMYENILPIAEFNELETYEKKNRMQYWRTNNTIKIIQNAMGITNAKYYDILNQLELPLDRTAKKERAPRKAKSVAVAAKKEAVKVAAPAEIAAPAPAADPVQEVIVHGMHLGFNGTYSADQIQKQLTKFISLLEDESEFYIEMKLLQKAAK